jgi:hypothetical protein
LEKAWIVNDVVNSRYAAGVEESKEEEGALVRGSIADEEHKGLSTPLARRPQFGST